MSATATVPAAQSECRTTGADVVVHALERHGVEIVAGIPGGTVLPLYAALARSTRIRHVLARHEQAAGFIAQGIARITRRPGVCIATSGPGVTNVLTALADAKLDSVPLVCITGQVPRPLIGTDAFQEVATVDIARPITKAVWRATDPGELETLIDEAFHTAQSGRQGPVLIDIPKDVQLATCPIRSESRLHTVPSLADCNELFDRAAALIDRAQRAMLYVGGGVVHAHAEGVLRRFAERGNIPVATTLMALGVLPHDHSLNCGMLGMHGSVRTNRLVHDCDVLIAVGARFDDRATGDPQRFAPHAKIIHIDIDAREFGKILEPALAVHADAAVALAALLDRVAPKQGDAWHVRHYAEDSALAKRSVSSVAQQFVSKGILRPHPNPRPLPQGREQTLKISEFSPPPVAGGGQGGGISYAHTYVPTSSGEHSLPHSIIAAIGAALPSDAIVTTDVGQHQMWVAQAYPFKRADRWLTSGGLGTMGFGLPAAIGAALADPDATVVCFTGDGSLLMNIQELATLAELALNVKIVLFDNGGLGLVHQQQTLFYERRYLASRFATASDFVRIAQSFGIAAVNVDSPADSLDDLRSALLAKGPMFLRVPIAPDELVLPMVAPGMANIDALCE